MDRFYDFNIMDKLEWNENGSPRKSKKIMYIIQMFWIKQHNLKKPLIVITKVSVVDAQKLIKG